MKIEEFLSTFLFDEMSTVNEEVTRLHRNALEEYPCRQCGKVYKSHSLRVRYAVISHDLCFKFSTNYPSVSASIPIITVNIVKYCCWLSLTGMHPLVS